MHAPPDFQALRLLLRQYLKQAQENLNGSVNQLAYDLILQIIGCNDAINVLTAIRY